ncbi:hypothetical protein G7077_07310 [Sphingomonas piscis]|uniref:Uncharacterized protein n=1 Tax=Sphingomonas piscis TaxID=2714943 RepID=A0A6G7YPR6_9SPHN|nr:hypothetical protein [Sphingomonas piscis]QIK78731.1 hypothetical protein G7077_07310 [Sphingomonas piscis]
MPVLPPYFGPRAAIADLLAFMRQRSREQRIGAVLAVVATAAIVIGFFTDTSINPKPATTVTFTQSWSADRSDAEIIADQKKDQAMRDAAKEKRRQEYVKLQKQLGMDE